MRNPFDALSNFFIERPVEVTFLAIGAVAFLFLFVLPMVSPAPTPITIVSEHTFTGQLGMVTYDHGWFGIGTTGTHLSFQNGSSIVTFDFDKDLPAIIGKNYSVTYTQKDKIYYDVAATPANSTLFEQALYYHNSTSIVPEEVILVP